MASRHDLPSCPVPHLLTSNDPPKEDEIPLILTVIAQAQLAENLLKEQLSREPPLISKINIDYDLQRTSEFIIAQQAILSPIRRLPVELLQYIFIYLVSSPLLVLELYVEDDQRMPLAISQVNQRWRAAAISCRQLWAKLPPIDLDEKHTRRQFYLNFLTELSRRSRNFPIGIHIRQLSLSSADHPAIPILLLHSTRWRKARIEMEISDDDQHLYPQIFSGLQAAKGRFGSLETLIIIGKRHSPSEFEGNPLDFVADAPRLRNVSLSGTCPPFTFPFSQLAAYSQESGFISQVDQLLHSPDGLKELRLVRVDFEDNTMLRSIMTLPQLVSLKIGFAWDTDDQNLLGCLVLPVVEELLVALVEPDENLLPNVISMVSRSNTPSLLRKVFLRTEDITPGELTSLLRLTPLITHLNVTFPPIEDIFSISNTSNGDLVAPLLQICEFSTTEPLSRQEIAALNDLATSRCEISVPGMDEGSVQLPGKLMPLRAIYVHYPDAIDREGPMLEQGTFNHWKPTSKLVELQEWKEDLRYHLSKRVGPLPPGIKGRNQRHSVSSILCYLADLKAYQMEEIYMSGIHRAIQPFSISEYGSSVAEIMEKWEPLQDGTGFPWVIYNTNFLVYLPRRHALRFSSEPGHRYKTVYGLNPEDDLPPPDLPWPLYWSV